MPKFTFITKDGLTPEISSFVCSIPGVWPGKRNAANFTCAEHAAFIVAQILQTNGVTFVVRGDPLPPPLSSFPQMKDEVKPPPSILAYQEDAIVKTANMNGIYFFHPCGAGKTFTMIVWTLFNSPDGRPIVIVTRAGARHHWLGQLARYTTGSAIALEGPFIETMQRVNDLTFDDVLKGSEVLLVEAPTGHAGVARYATVAAIVKRLKVEGAVRLLAGMTPAGVFWRRLVEVTQPMKLGRSGREILDRGSYRFIFAPDVEREPLPRFFVLGWESLARFADFVITLKPGALGMDEIHRCKSNQRWVAIHDGLDDDGQEKVHFEQRDNMAAAAMRLSRAIPKRCASSATPIRDRVRDLWAQLDLLRPGEFGSWRSFTGRYCDACETIYTTWDTTGASNVAELQQRLTFLMHTVTKEETHKNLPAMRRDVVYLPAEEQDDLDREDREWFKREYQQAAVRGKLAIIEAKLAEAAARKRSFALNEIMASLEAGQKLVIGVTRQRDCERLGREVEKALRKLKGEFAAEPRVWMAHGGHGVDYRREIQQAYWNHPGPCCIVGTVNAWGESIDLQCTDLALVLALPYTYGALDQFEGRFTRQGQDRPFLCKYIIAEGTDDERIADILLSKLPQVVDALNRKDANEMNQAFMFGGKTQDQLLAELVASFGDE